MESVDRRQSEAELGEPTLLSRNQKKKLKQWLIQERHFYAADGIHYLRSSCLDLLYTCLADLGEPCHFVGSTVPQFRGYEIPSHDADFCVWLEKIIIDEQSLCQHIGNRLHNLLPNNQKQFIDTYFESVRTFNENICMMVFNIGYPAKHRDKQALQVDLSFCSHNVSPGLFTPGRGEIKLDNWLYGAESIPKLSEQIPLFCRGATIEIWQAALDGRELEEPAPQNKYQGLLRYPKWVCNKNFRRNPILEHQLWERFNTDFPGVQEGNVLKIRHVLHRRLSDDPQARCLQLLLWHWLVDDAPLDSEVKIRLQGVLKEFWRDYLIPELGKGANYPHNPSVALGLLKLGLCWYEGEHQCSLGGAMISQPLKIDRENAKIRGSVHIKGLGHWPSICSESPLFVATRLLERLRHLERLGGTLPPPLQWLQQPLYQYAAHLCIKWLRSCKVDKCQQEAFSRYLSLTNGYHVLNSLGQSTLNGLQQLPLPGLVLELQEGWQEQLVQPLPSDLKQGQPFAHMRQQLSDAGVGGIDLTTIPDRNALQQASRALLSWGEPIWDAVGSQLRLIALLSQPNEASDRDDWELLVKIAESNLSDEQKQIVLQGWIDYGDPLVSAIATALLDSTSKPATAVAILALIDIGTVEGATAALAWYYKQQPHGIRRNVIQALSQHPSTFTKAVGLACKSPANLSELIPLIQRANQFELTDSVSKLAAAIFLLLDSSQETELLLEALNELDSEQQYRALVTLQQSDQLPAEMTSLLIELLQSGLPPAATAKVIKWLQAAEVTFFDEHLMYELLANKVQLAEQALHLAEGKESGYQQCCLKMSAALVTVDFSQALAWYRKAGQVDDRQAVAEQLLNVAPIGDFQSLYDEFVAEFDNLTLAPTLCSRLTGNSITAMITAGELDKAEQELQKQREQLLPKEQAKLCVALGEALLAKATDTFLASAYHQLSPETQMRVYVRLGKKAIEQENIDTVSCNQIDAAEESLARSDLPISAEEIESLANHIHIVLEQISQITLRVLALVGGLDSSHPDQKIGWTQLQLAVIRTTAITNDVKGALRDLKQLAPQLSQDLSLADSYSAMYRALTRKPTELEAVLLFPEIQKLLYFLVNLNESGMEAYPGIHYFEQDRSNLGPIVEAIMQHYVDTSKQGINRWLTGCTMQLSNLISQISKDRIDSKQRVKLYQCGMQVTSLPLDNDLVPLCDHVLQDALRDPVLTDTQKMKLLQENQERILARAHSQGELSIQVLDPNKQADEVLLHPYYRMLRRLYDRLTKTVVEHDFHRKFSKAYVTTALGFMRFTCPSPALRGVRDARRIPRCTDLAVSLSFQLLAKLERDSLIGDTFIQERIQLYQAVIYWSIRTNDKAHRLLALELLYKGQNLRTKKKETAQFKAKYLGQPVTASVVNCLQEIGLATYAQLPSSYAYRNPVGGEVIMRDMTKGPSVFELFEEMDLSEGRLFGQMTKLNNLELDAKRVPKGLSIPKAKQKSLNSETSRVPRKRQRRRVRKGN